MNIVFQSTLTSLSLAEYFTWAIFFYEHQEIAKGRNVKIQFLINFGIDFHVTVHESLFFGERNEHLQD